MTTDKALVGNAGEHYVAFQLSGRGYAVGLTARGTEGIDLLAANNKTGKAITIQVKTMKEAYTGSWWKWRIGRHLAEDPPRDNLFLAFVDLRGGPSQTPEQPHVFIVPATRLGPLVTRFPKDPMKGPPKDFWVDIEEKDAPNFRNCWELIDAALI